MKTVMLEKAPKSPNPAQLDEVMRQVSKSLGEKWTAVKMSGYWLFYQGEGTSDLVLQSRKTFLNALSEAVNSRSDESITIVNTVPL